MLLGRYILTSKHVKGRMLNCTKNVNVPVCKKKKQSIHIDAIQVKIGGTITISSIHFSYIQFGQILEELKNSATTIKVEVYDVTADQINLITICGFYFKNDEDMDSFKEEVFTSLLCPSRVIARR